MHGSKPTFGSSIWNSQNVQNLAILHGFIKASLFPFSNNFQLLLRLVNLPHKRMGLDLRLGQVLWNSENDQNLAVCHGYFNASLFSFSTNLQLLCAQQIYHTKKWVQTYVWVKFRGILRTFKIQLFGTVLLKQVCFPFLLTCSYYQVQQIYHTKELVQTNVWVMFRGIFFG